MISIDFDKFNDELELHYWLQTTEGCKVFNHIYDIVLQSYGTNCRHIPVITKKTDTGEVYSIDMNNVAEFCKKAILHYELYEDYEKCGVLLKIINEEACKR
jgi:hypothetical protein